ncbi:MAG: type II/IV secretion system protein [Sedimentisphaerales bacterium]|nr:type II/IV secretion system protein [Sedimentisphaerales bacterium]
MADCCSFWNLTLSDVSRAQTGGALSLAELPFNPLRLVLLIAWVYLCLYSVQCVQFNPFVPDKYKGLANVLALVVGPVLLLGLFIAETAKKSRRSQESFFAVLRDQVEHAVTAVRTYRFKSRSDEGSALHLLDSAGRSMDEVYGHSGGKIADARILDLTERTVANALERRASDILIDPKDGDTYTVRLRVDGALTTVSELDAKTCRAVINSIKAVSGMDIGERRRPQDGGFMARKGHAVASFRVASAGALNGEKLSIRVLNKDAGVLTLAAIGLAAEQRALIEKALQKPSGMILICGPTGSGKTTTMYAMLNQIDRFTRNVITVEDPIEAVLPQASQIEINPKADITFAKTLRSVLRQDPDVICVGEIRDEETAEIALRASQTGHLVLATLHCDSNATALVRLLDLGVSRLLLSSGLSLLLSQRLLRRLCDRCKQPVVLSDKQIATFERKGIDHSHMFRAGRCKHCNQTGYLGRTAICDILMVDDQLKAQIAGSEAFLADMKTNDGKKSRSRLRRHGMSKVAEGVTSLEELKRVVG